mmetsp:Transcript_3169/g.5557  ORF Transcript_3169/g.5557 Transcript_3169/m.5557 type:complete len:264 (-) Transcript_3169:229-1020(-)
MILLRRATLILLFLLCGGVKINCTAIPSSTAWPTLGSSKQIKPDSSTCLHDDDNSIADKRRTKHNISCTTSCRCKFFLWNFISYIKFKETTSLVKENTIEGLGGKRFVRVKPGSLLERWYPQLRANQLKTDGCFLCGHTFREHLEYWWWCKKGRSNGGYSKFESVIGDGGSDNEHDSFHSKYVDELGTNKQKRGHKGLEVRTSFEGGVSYVVPPFDPLVDGKPKRVWTVMVLALARTSALVRLEDLIWLERIEYLKSKGVENG